MTLHPAGVSKRTGMPYKEFYGCDNKECWSKGNAQNGPVISHNPREMEEALARMREWGLRTEERLKKMEETIGVLQAQINSYRTLFVDIKGETAVTAHEALATIPII